jgi:nicotinamidase-related amidase
MANTNKNTALLVIDYQEGFHDPKWGARNLPQAEENASRVLRHFRQNSFPVYHVRHLSRNPNSPLRPGQPGVDFIEGVKPAPGERIFQKHVNSAFIGTNLEAVLRQNEIETLVIFGIAVDHCVSTTTRMAANLGFHVFVVADATIAHERKGYDGRTFDPDLVHAISLASLHGEFATVETTETILDLFREAK